MQDNSEIVAKKSTPMALNVPIIVGHDHKDQSDQSWVYLSIDVGWATLTVLLPSRENIDALIETLSMHRDAVFGAKNAIRKEF